MQARDFVLNLHKLLRNQIFEKMKLELETFVLLQTSSADNFGATQSQQIAMEQVNKIIENIQINEKLKQFLDSLNLESILTNFEETIADSAKTETFKVNSPVSNAEENEKKKSTLSHSLKAIFTVGRSSTKKSEEHQQMPKESAEKSLSNDAEPMGLGLESKEDESALDSEPMQAQGKEQILESGTTETFPVNIEATGNEMAPPPTRSGDLSHATKSRPKPRRAGQSIPSPSAHSPGSTGNSELKDLPERQKSVDNVAPVPPPKRIVQSNINATLAEIMTAELNASKIKLRARPDDTIRPTTYHPGGSPPLPIKPRPISLADELDNTVPNKPMPPPRTKSNGTSPIVRNIPTPVLLNHSPASVTTPNSESHPVRSANETPKTGSPDSIGQKVHSEQQEGEQHAMTKEEIYREELARQALQRAANSPKQPIVSVQSTSGPTLIFKKKDNSRSGDDKAQEKSAIDWLNKKLKTKDITVDSLASLNDGLVLIYCMEECTGIPVPKYNKRAMLPVHKMDNIAIALQILSKYGVDTSGVTATGI